MVEMSMKSDHYRALDRHGRQSSTKKTVHRRRAEPPGILDRPVLSHLSSVSWESPSGYIESKDGMK